MKKYFMLVFILVCLLVFTSSFAEVKFKWGPYLRLRHEYWKNIYDMDNDRPDNRNFFRIKTSLWGQADFNKDISLYIKLTDEFKAYTYYAPSSSKPSGKTDKHLNFDINEAVFDNLYLDLKNVLGYPLDLRAGRQDLSSSEYGEGFLLADGTPRDGSRTYYFNALKSTWRLDDKNSVEFIAIKDNKTDDILPVINRQDGEQALNYSDEFAYVLYYKSDAIKNLHLENYYIYKREDSDRPSPLTEKSLINTFGSYAKYSFSPWTLRAQLAGQFGTYGNKDREGIGGYVFLDRGFKDVLFSPQASLGYYYLSGGRPSDSKYKGFDQLFSTYAWVSELYNLSYSMETGTGYWTNLQMYRTSLVLNLTKKAKATVIYDFLRAIYPQPGINASFGTGKTRGHLPHFKLDYAFNKNVSAYFLAEYFAPGDFYVDKSDAAVFLRSELQIKF